MIVVFVFVVVFVSASAVAVAVEIESSPFAAHASTRIRNPLELFPPSPRQNQVFRSRPGKLDGEFGADARGRSRDPDGFPFDVIGIVVWFLVRGVVKYSSTAMVGGAHIVIS